MSSFSRAYLKAYNVIQILGWTAVYFLFIYVAVDHFLINPSPLSFGLHLARFTQIPLSAFQFLMILDVINAISGLVHASPLTCAIQIASRLLVVVALLVEPAVWTESIGLALIHAAWCPAEVLRYVYYVKKSSRDAEVPRWLTWLRYSAFVVLYPTGITGELFILRKAQVIAQSKNILWVVYAIWAVFVIYVPGSIYLFAHMFQQRGKSLNKNKSSEKKEQKNEGEAASGKNTKGKKGKKKSD